MNDEPQDEEANTPDDPGRWRRFVNAVKARFGAARRAWPRLRCAPGPQEEVRDAEATPARTPHAADHEEENEDARRRPPAWIKPLAVHGAVALCALAVGAMVSYAALRAQLEAQAATERALDEALEAAHQARGKAERAFLAQQLELVKAQKALAQLREAAPPNGTLVALHSEDTTLIAPPNAQPSCPQPPAVALAPAPPVKPIPRRAPAVQTAARAPSPAAPVGECVLGKGSIAEDLKECVQLFNRTQ